MIITTIEPFKYSYKIYLDEEYIGVLRKKTLKSNCFYEGQEINNIEELKQIILNDEYESGKNKILRQLGFSSKTEKEIVKYLQREYFQERTIEMIIIFLKEYKFLDDESYAKNYIQSAKLSKKSRRAIKNSLVQKGFEKDTISESLNLFSEEEEYNNALNIGQKKMKTMKENNYYEKVKKLKNHLVYKGFDYNVSDRVVRILLDKDLE